MAEIETKTLSQMLTDQAQAAQSKVEAPLNFSSGSLFLALARAFSSIGLWLQAQILKVLLRTRLSTSKDGDVDSFIQDFGLSRTKATFAKGEVTMSRFTPGVAAVIPVGAGLRTSDAQTSFVVTADPSHPRWSVDFLDYRMLPSDASITVPIQAVVAGRQGNVQAGTITLLTTPIIGIDSAINQSQISGGEAQQSDDSVKAAFPKYIASLSQAVRAAIDRAIDQVQPGLSWTVLEGQAADALQVGFVVVINDGGLTAPGAGLISSVYKAVDQVRALGVPFAVISATIVPVEINITITTSSNKPAAVQAVSKKVNEYISTLNLGETLSYTKLIRVVGDSSPLITDVSQVLINGFPTSLSVTGSQVIRAAAVVVS